MQDLRAFCAELKSIVLDRTHGTLSRLAHETHWLDLNGLQVPEILSETFSDLTDDQSSDLLRLALYLPYAAAWKPNENAPELIPEASQTLRDAIWATFASTLLCEGRLNLLDLDAGELPYPNLFEILNHDQRKSLTHYATYASKINTAPSELGQHLTCLTLQCGPTDSLPDLSDWKQLRSVRICGNTRISCYEFAERLPLGSLRRLSCPYNTIMIELSPLAQVQLEVFDVPIAIWQISEAAKLWPNCTRLRIAESTDVICTLNRLLFLKRFTKLSELGINSKDPNWVAYTALLFPRAHFGQQHATLVVDWSESDADCAALTDAFKLLDPEAHVRICCSCSTRLPKLLNAIRDSRLVASRVTIVVQLSQEVTKHLSQEYGINFVAPTVWID